MTESNDDVFQHRYLKHQQNKKKQLTYQDQGSGPSMFTKQDAELFSAIAHSRRSQRIFNHEPITDDELQHILSLTVTAPSSCNRQAISGRIVRTRDDKEVLTGILVGGVGWIHRADTIVLLFANGSAYKAGDEIHYMPYLDAGVVIQQFWLSCEVYNIGCAYINPNIRPINQDFFRQRFGGDGLIYCGAMALGHYDKKATSMEKRKDFLL